MVVIQKNMLSETDVHFFFFYSKCNRLVNWTCRAWRAAQGSLQHFRRASFQRYILDFLPFTSVQCPHYTLMRRRARPRTFARGQTFQYSFPHFELLSKNKCLLILRLGFFFFCFYYSTRTVVKYGCHRVRTRQFQHEIFRRLHRSPCGLFPPCTARRVPLYSPLDGRSDVVAADCTSGTCLFSSFPFNIHVSLAGVVHTQCVRMRPIIIKPP